MGQPVRQKSFDFHCFSSWHRVLPRSRDKNLVPVRVPGRTRHGRWQDSGREHFRLFCHGAGLRTPRLLQRVDTGPRPDRRLERGVAAGEPIWGRGKGGSSLGRKDGRIVFWFKRFHRMSNRMLSNNKTNLVGGFGFVSFWYCLVWGCSRRYSVGYLGLSISWMRDRMLMDSSVISSPFFYIFLAQHAPFMTLAQIMTRKLTYTCGFKLKRKRIN